MAVKKSPETEASVMATRDSRPVREEVVDKVGLTDPLPLDIDLALSWTQSLLSSWSLSLPLSTSSLALNHCSDILK
jgi:hypothetical protein